MPDTTDRHLPTVVYVEDNSGDAVLLEEALRERGHSVELLILESGDKALRYFKIKDSARDIPPPHCILLDSNLPAVSGTQLIIFIRQSEVFDRTPVYIFASRLEYKAIIEMVSVSRESFLTKPDTWLQFLELADLLMGSAKVCLDGEGDLPPGRGPELRAADDLRLEDARRKPRALQ
jgi:CheY-like chemotaxis protein